MLKNVNTLKLINLKLVLYCFLPYLCVIIKGVIKIPYSLTTKKQKNENQTTSKQPILLQ